MHSFLHWEHPAYLSPGTRWLNKGRQFKMKAAPKTMIAAATGMRLRRNSVKCGAGASTTVLKQAAMTLSITTSRTSNGQGDTAIPPCQRRHTATTARASEIGAGASTTVLKQAAMTLSITTSRTSNGQGDTAIPPCQRRHTATTARAS